jgi:penicillin amidase
MRKKRLFRRWVNLTISALVVCGILYVSIRGMGPLPPLGPAFNPSTGIWTVAKEATPPTSATLHLTGLQQPVEVTFDPNGIASIKAASDHDLFLAMGYVHSKFRLLQMDLMRRQGEGRLSQVIGKKALSSDKFELQLGLLRTAQAEWAKMSATDPARQALIAYAQGVDDRIQQDKRTGKLPFMFKLMGYQPSSWTPVDSLVIQGIMTQTLDFTTTPLDYALLSKSLGYQRTMQWFPIIPADQQHPYDLGPYHKDAAPIESQLDVNNAEWQAAVQIEKKLKTLPSTAIHHGSNSNNWAVNGPKSASGMPLMAGDPHLDQTIPSIWYQLTGNSPDYHFNGVSIPGMPLVLIGHNQHISWSLTNVQNQATFFYDEKTDPAHPHQYYWQGAWHPMKTVNYAIPVKNNPPVHFQVDLTVHGPIMTTNGQTMSVDWIGAMPSPDVNVLMNITKASNFQEFRSALSKWHAPSQNFIYADDKGNIGLISAGYYPIIKQGNPWMPLSGTGESDIVGTIPYQDIPQVYDPKSHFVFSANQREVAKDYPYYIGTASDFFSSGYRADEIYRVLSQGNDFTVSDMEKLQNDVRDYLAGRIVPKLVATLNATPITGQETTAKSILSHWNDQMSVNSPAASIWWVFWSNYLQATFEPWWQAKHVPTSVDPQLQVGPEQTALNEDLEYWTLHDPKNPAFSLPDGTSRSADTVMVLAFKKTIKDLSSQLGSQPSLWNWGKLHSRQFQSILQIPMLGYGPRPSSGDSWTVDAADSKAGYVSHAGPSWRFIMNWGTKRGIGVYPGGQSENPLSPWYENFVQAWWNGNYYPLNEQVSNTIRTTQATWKLTP